MRSVMLRVSYAWSCGKEGCGKASHIPIRNEEMNGVVSMKWTCAIVFPSILASVQAFGATYHVAQQHPAADDANPGTAERPWRAISKAAGIMKPGDRVIVHAGLYREWVNPGSSGTPTAPIAYEAAAGEEVVLTGLDAAAGWIQDDAAVWKLANWTTRFMVSADRDSHPGGLVGRAEQVVVAGTLLQQVLNRAEMTPGTFCADSSAQTLYVWLGDGSSPNTQSMQVGRRGYVFGVNPWQRPAGVDDIHVRGFTVRYASNHAQRGALYILGNRWVVEDMTVEWTNGCGWSIGGNAHVLRRIVSRHNGQMGGGGRGRDLLMEDCVFADNNRKGYSANWEAGGIKIVCSRGAVVRRCVFVRNNGPGLWLDIDNRDALITECYSADNTGSGISIEISGWCTLTHNLCVRNGTGTDRDLEGWGSGGITIAESRNCTVRNNICVYNRDGITMRDQGPRTHNDIDGRAATWFCTQNTFTHNILAYNRGFQFAYWADNNFYGKHPSHAGELTPEDLKRSPPYDPAKMEFTIDHNLYFPPENRPLQLWGCPWRERSHVVQTLADTRRDLGFDLHSVVADPMFDKARTDFRLQPDSPTRAAKMGPLTETVHQLAAEPDAPPDGPAPRARW